jgi:hypothetical protein
MGPYDLLEKVIRVFEQLQIWSAHSSRILLRQILRHPKM